MNSVFELGLGLIELTGSAFVVVKEYADTICTQLVCRLSADDLYCNNVTTVAAAEGTRCGHNKICLGGDCVDMFESTGRSASEEPADVNECIYGDHMIRNSTLRFDDADLDDLQLPDERMSCEEFMEFLIDSKLSPFVYCSVPSIRKSCCQSCRSRISLPFFQDHCLLKHPDLFLHVSSL